MLPIESAIDELTLGVTMDHVNLSAYLPLMLSIYDESPQIAAENVRIARELTALADVLPLPLVRAFGATRTTVDLYRRTKKKSTLGKREKKIFDWLGRAPRAFLVAAVHCEIELDMRPLIVSDESGRQVVLGERDTIEYYRSVLSEALAHDMHHLVVAANIAAPCGLEAGEGVIVMGDEFARTTESLISNLWAVVELSNTTGWSPVRSLPLVSVLDWTTR
ncbi:MAG TPA: hypothetical protein VK679_16965, partial [Gemmatimonadaceae bacterium]|nr:hypothetical protein [Gemmatimonadaceae bacterium]